MFSYSIWLRTPIEQRQKIAAAFGIQKKKSTHVADNHIIDDGYYIQDVESALTCDSIKAYLVTDESEPAVLWNMLIEKIEGREPVVVEEPVVITATPEPVPIVVTASEPVIEIKTSEYILTEENLNNAIEVLKSSSPKKGEPMHVEPHVFDEKDVIAMDSLIPKEQETKEIKNEKGNKKK